MSLMAKNSLRIPVFSTVYLSLTSRLWLRKREGEKFYSLSILSNVFFTLVTGVLS